MSRDAELPVLPNKAGWPHEDHVREECFRTMFTHARTYYWDSHNLYINNILIGTKPDVYNKPATLTCTRSK